MNEWQCPIDELDEDIREVCRVLFDNNMHPYNSCSGSYKDHQGKHELPECACVYMLDSPMARELLAILINNKNFKCTISKEKACEFYGNALPEGLRIKIDFENIEGNTSKYLLEIIQSVIQGRKAPSKDREKVDLACRLLSDFQVSPSNPFGISFSFNDQLINPTNGEGENYSIEVIDRKDFLAFYNQFGKGLDAFVQDNYSSKFLLSDYATTIAYLEKLKQEYQRIPYLGRAASPQVFQSSARKNKFTINSWDKTERARQKLEEAANERLFRQSSVSNLDILREILNKSDAPQDPPTDNEK